MSRSGRGRRWLGNAAGYGVVLGLLVAWYLTFAPTELGGPAAYNAVSGHSMDGTYRTGDLVITRERDTYAVGDIVTFRVDDGQVIHRIIGGDGETGYTLQGDNNPGPDPWHPVDADVVGKAWIHIPGGGEFLGLPREPLFAGLLAVMLTLVVLLAAGGHKEKPGKRRPAGPTAVATRP